MDYRRHLTVFVLGIWFYVSIIKGDNFLKGVSLSDSSTEHECDEHKDSADVEECKKDTMGFAAIVHIHNMIDDDNNGDVDLSESNEFMRDELQLSEGLSMEKQSIFHGNDKLISVTDLWHAWKRSTVYNWTTEDVVSWLVKHVELPSYAESFKTNEVDGPKLARLAVADNTYLTQVLGVKNAIHRRKISVKAMDLVLFGPPREKNKFIKEMALTCTFAVVVLFIAIYQQRKFRQKIEKMQKAEKQLQELQEKLNEAERLQESSVKGSTDNLSDFDKYSREESEEDSSRYREEIAQLKQQLTVLQSQSKWVAPQDLQWWLMLTFEVESAYFAAKRKEANQRVQVVKEACEKIRRKKGSVFGYLRLASDNVVDESDQRIQEAKASLEEINLLVKERNRRWQTIEKLCEITLPRKEQKTPPSLMEVIQKSQAIHPRVLHRPHIPLPNMNVDDGELDEDLPPGYPGPALFMRSTLSGLPRPTSMFTGCPPRTSGLRLRTAAGMATSSSSNGIAKGPDRTSNNSTPVTGSISSEDAEKPTFNLGENLPDSPDGTICSLDSLSRRQLFVNKPMSTSHSYTFAERSSSGRQDSLVGSSIPETDTLKEEVIREDSPMHSCSQSESDLNRFLVQTNGHKRQDSQSSLTSSKSKSKRIFKNPFKKKDKVKDKSF